MQIFRKKERLCNFNSINTLFAEGHSFFIYPFKLLWLEDISESQSPAQLLISVPKRNFKRAVDRNLIKRQIRESFRRNKDELYAYLEQEKRNCSFALVYAAKSKIAYCDLNAALILVLKQLVKEIKNSA
jgi:ribonuclease P protein component